MKWTKEQQAIIEAKGNLRVNAIAGSGKTSTLIEYAANQPKNKRLLYLAFNSSVQSEAYHKFKEKGIHNVFSKTAHSLAKREIIDRGNYELQGDGYKPHQIADILNLKGKAKDYYVYILCTHVRNFIAYFCNSTAASFEELDYAESVNEPTALAFAIANEKFILKYTKQFFNLMDTGKIPVTHDYYLKKFQLTNPILEFDYILFDEGQDASPAMLDIFLKQDCIKVIVGDTHQQIYSWRYAVNSLEQVDFQTLHLSNSFRFNKEVATLSKHLLAYKKVLDVPNDCKIVGRGKSKANKIKAVIARTNVQLLSEAFFYVIEAQVAKRIYFEGGFKSYTFAGSGASLWDVYNLYEGNHKYIKDKMIRSMNSINELQSYIKQTGDLELNLIVEIILQYKSSFPNILKTLGDRCVPQNERESADLIFTTAHRSKGMEYDVVKVCNDFIDWEEINKQLNGPEAPSLDQKAINEEINLLYVSATRTKNILYIPSQHIPKPIEAFKTIKPQYLFDRDIFDIERNRPTVTVTYIAEPDFSNPWTPEDENKLIEMVNDGYTVLEIAAQLERTKKAVALRMHKLNVQFD